MDCCESSKTAPEVLKISNILLKINMNYKNDNLTNHRMMRKIWMDL